MQSPKRASQKYSGDPKFSARRARGAQAIIRTMVENRPPNTEYRVLIPRAKPVFPRLEILYPSKVVAMEAGVPGVLIAMAEIPQEKIAEL